MKKNKALLFASISGLFLSLIVPSVLSVKGEDDPEHGLDEERHAYVVKEVFDDELADGVSIVWSTGNGKFINSGFHSSKSWQQSLQAEKNSEIYWEFETPIDFRDTTNDFNEEGAIEFYLNTTSQNTWYKLYAFSLREDPGGSKVNQKYNRSEIDITMYIDRARTGEWQFVQVPLRNFSSRGAYVDSEGTRQTGCNVDLSNIIGVGIAQIGSKDGETSKYDKMRFTNMNLPDKYLGCKMVQGYEMDEYIAEAEITKVDLSPYATTGFEGGPTIGWSGQGVDNELTGFDLFGNQTLGHIPYYIVDPETNNGKSVIGLRNDGSGKAIYTKKVDIPVNQMMDGFYMIHNQSWTGSSHPTDYTFNYEDGTSYKLEIQYGVHIYNWWGSDESDVCPVYWVGTNHDATEGYNMNIKLNGFACVNKFPNKKVTSLTFEVYPDNTESEDLIVALTLVDAHGKGLYMPYLDNPYNPDTSSWYEYEMPVLGQIVGSPLDISYMMDPHDAAGIDAKGRITTKDGNFIYKDSGETVRFSGVNICGALIYQSTQLDDNNVTNHSRTDTLVDVLAAYGYNLVRIMDWDATFYHPNFFDNAVYDKANPHYGINEKALDAFFYFIYKCKEKGIYIQFCCIGGRTGSAFPNLDSERQKDIGAGAKFEIFIDEEIEEEVLRVVKIILTEVNPYTHTKLVEDNQLALMEIANESNFSNMYGLYTSSKSYEFVSTYYISLAAHEFTDFLIEKYGSIAEIANAWKDPEGKKTGLSKQERNDVLVSLTQGWKSDKYTDSRKQDTFSFIYEKEINFYKRVYDKLVGEEFNVLCPLTATTNLPSESMQDLYINAQFDYIARHGYASHPTTGTEYQVGTATGSVYSQASKLNNLFSNLAGMVVYNEALIVNETNIAEPSRYSGELSTMMSAIYSYQGWNVCTFTFANTSFDAFGNQITDSFSILNKPTRMGTLTGGAILFYSQEISQASRGYYTALDTKQAVEDYDAQTWSIVAGLYLVGRAGVYFVDENGDNINTENGNPTNADELLEAINHQYITSENGEMIFAKDGSFFAINTPSTQSVTGTYGDRKITLNDVSIKTENRYSTVTLSALQKQVDGTVDKTKTIKDSDHLLLNATATMRNTGSAYSTDGLEITGYGDSPILVEPVVGEVTLRSKDEFKVYALNSSGQRTNVNVETKKDSHGYTVICLKESDKAMNYEIIRTSVANYQRLNKYHDVEDEDNSLVNDYGQYLASITNDLFMLDSNITRGDFMVSLVKAFDLEKGGNVNQFADVDQYYYGYDELLIGRSNYIYYPTYFRPYDELTKVELYEMYYNFLVEVKEMEFDTENAFEFNEALESVITSDQVEAINCLFASGLISQNEIETLTKTDKVTRREVLELIKSLMSSTDPVDPVDPTDPVEPSKPKSKGCRGEIVASTLIVSLVSFAGVSLIISKKNKEN